MNKHIDIKPEYLNTVKDILRSHLPPHAKTWLFGSRASGKAKTYSDIDLLIDLGEPIPLEILANLTLAFEESNLPYKVDLADAAAINKTFHDNIKEQLILLTL